MAEATIVAFCVGVIVGGFLMFVFKDRVIKAEKRGMAAMQARAEAAEKSAESWREKTTGIAIAVAKAAQSKVDNVEAAAGKLGEAVK
jgi:uncharacterized membrane protein